MTETSILCPACGAKNESENQFCIKCGVVLARAKVSSFVENATLTSDPHSEVSESENRAQNSKRSSRKNLILLTATVLVSFVAGAGLASVNVFSGIIGDRYTEKRLKNEKQQSFIIGYDSGDDAGYERGESNGYRAGKSFGCNSVFNSVSADKLIAIFYPYNRFNLGDYYIDRSNTC